MRTGCCCSGSSIVFADLVVFLYVLFANLCTKEVFRMLCLHRYVDSVGDISPHKVGRRFT